MMERTGAPEGDTRGVSPSLAPVFSCAHYFQAGFSFLRKRGVLNVGVVMKSNLATVMIFKS